jgi:hypothetical protein
MSINRDSLSDEAKVAIILCSLFFGFICAIIIYHLTYGDGLISILTFIGVSLAHPFIGAFVVALCEDLKQWAYVDKAERWPRDQTAYLAAAWPLTLIGCLVLYIYLGIIHRIY